MAAEYDFRRRPNPKGDGELQPLYPRIVNKGTIEMERLVHDIADMSSFTPGDVKGVVALLEDRISYYLSEGHHVQLGDIGYFSASLQARPVMDPKDFLWQSTPACVSRFPETLCGLCRTCQIWFPKKRGT